MEHEHKWKVEGIKEYQVFGKVKWFSSKICDECKEKELTPMEDK